MQELRDIKITDYLPHRPPFLLIDAVEEYVPCQKLVAIKRVTADERMLVGDNQGNFYFPETLVSEAAAQAVLLFARLNGLEDCGAGAVFVLTKIEAEFFKKAGVGDCLHVTVEKIRRFGQGGYADVEVKVGKELAAKVSIFFGLLKE